VQISSNVLPMVRQVWTLEPSYRPQGNCSGGQANQATISRVWVMCSVSILLAELVDNLVDAIKVSIGEGVTDNIFESSSQYKQ
jgi:hypothetical protein